MIAEAHLTTQPCLHVTVAFPGDVQQHSTVADTGAQVCMAGCQLMRDLGLSKCDLQDTTMSIKHLSGGRLHVLGGSTCTFSVGGCTMRTCLYFTEGVQQLYLSLDVCDCGCFGPGGGTTTTNHPPTQPPYALTEDNMALLEQWLLYHFGRMTFNVDRTPLPAMSGPPHHIHLCPDAQPLAVHSPASHYQIPNACIAPLMKPFRELLKKPSGKMVYWDSQLQDIFETTQQTIGQLAAEGLQYYDITRPTTVVKYLKGEANRTADTLSRYPMLHSKPDKTDLADDETMCSAVVVATACSLECNEGLVMDLSMGRDSMLCRARQSVYWPEINAAVEQKRRQCHTCEVNAPSAPAEPLMATPLPTHPFQEVVVDLFQLLGEVYAAYADRLTS
ncbi:hypothetical protein E2C01_051282 [Portunus trituberculatus]|uniref:RNA-directed DNA polymerase n=1 Tax=Portunus trituberculatus TaxID=210409 RepID=A0A5B7GIS0_PORTR|nr:hypothetical protein [Portunus trituberculatus]